MPTALLKLYFYNQNGGNIMLNINLLEENKDMMLHAEGNRTLDATGRDILLSGVNCASLEWSYNPPKLMKSIFAALDEWKSNCIRLPLHPNGWFGFFHEQQIHDKDGTGYKEFVDEIVNQIAARKKYVILDYHQSNCGVLGQKDYGYMPDMHSILFWEDVAIRYQNHPNVLFGLFNEPRVIGWDIWKNGGTITSQCKIDGQMRVSTFKTPGMQKLIDIVRKAGADNIVITGGIDWGWRLDGMKNGYMLEDKKGNGIILDSHVYPWKDLDWDTYVTVMADEYPIIIGECGHSGEERKPENPQKEVSAVWVPKLLKWMDDHNYHVTAWDFHHLAGPCLVENLEDFEPTKYWGAYFKEFLKQRSERL